MKHLYYLCFLTALFVSCDKSEEYQTGKPRDAVASTFLGTKSTEGTAVEEYVIYVYGPDTALVAQVDGNRLEVPQPVDLPYLEELKAIVVGNGAGVTTGTDSLTTLRISLGERCDKEIFVSEVVSFKTDAVGKSVEFDLKRAVGKASFTPTETETEIRTVSAFDQIRVSFKDVTSAYLPGASESDRYEVSPVVAVGTDKSGGFAASVFCYAAGTAVKVGLEYLLNGEPVNATKEDVPENGLSIRSSVDAQVRLSLYESYYLNQPFAVKSQAARQPAVMLNYVEF